MAKQKPTPVITHTETLCYAINYLTREIEEKRVKCSRLPPHEAEEMFAALTADMTSKLEALKELYRFETGTEYCG